MVVDQPGLGEGREVSVLGRSDKYSSPSISVQRLQDDGAFLFVGEFDSAGEQIAERVVLSIGRDDLGDEGVRE